LCRTRVNRPTRGGETKAFFKATEFIVATVVVLQLADAFGWGVRLPMRGSLEQLR
jgi:hypothetical protein